MWLLIAMSTVNRITKSLVDAMEVKCDRPSFLWDAGLPGYGVKCSKAAVKTYVVKYRVDGGGRSARQRWLTLGRHGKLTPDQARKMAQQALAAVARGEDPQAEKVRKREVQTLDDVWQRFRSEHLPSRKPQTRYEYERQWDTSLGPAFGRVTPDAISKSDVDRFHKRLRATPYQANRLLALLSRLMTLAESWDYRPAGTNPCRHVERFKEASRERYLKASEIERLGVALRELNSRNEITRDAANAVRLLLITGARLTEILSLQWSFIDFDRGLAELPDSKTGVKTLVLGEAAMRLLRAQALSSNGVPFVFPGPGRDGRLVNLRKSWLKLCKEANLTGVRLHDLRHTAASVAVGQGTSLPIIGRLLGHSQPQTTQRYAHVDIDPALSAANTLGDAIDASLNPRRPTVEIEDM